MYKSTPAAIGPLLFIAFKAMVEAVVEGEEEEEVAVAVVAGPSLLKERSNTMKYRLLEW